MITWCTPSIEYIIEEILQKKVQLWMVSWVNPRHPWSSRLQRRFNRQPCRIFGPKFYRKSLTCPSIYRGILESLVVHFQAKGRPLSANRVSNFSQGSLLYFPVTRNKKVELVYDQNSQDSIRNWQLYTNFKKSTPLKNALRIKPDLEIPN